MEMHAYVFILLLAGWEHCGLAVRTTDRFSPLQRWLHKREAYSATRVDSRLHKSTNPQNAGADTRAGTTKVTIFNSTGFIQPSKTYNYPFGRERTQYVDVPPGNRSRISSSSGGDSGGGARRAQRIISADSSNREARRSSSSLQGPLSYEEEKRRRDEERSVLLRQREELIRRRQEIEQMRRKQREEEEAVRKEEEEQRKRQREEEIRRRTTEEEDRRRRQKEEEQSRIEEERRKQLRESDNVGSESNQAYEERRRIQEERRRRYYEQQRRKQQASLQTTTHNYGNQTPRPTSADTWQRGGGPADTWQRGGGSAQTGPRTTFVPGSHNFPSGSAQGWDQQSGYRYGDPRVVVSGPRGFGTQYEDSQVNYNQEETSECPDVGVEMRINGLDCQNAIRTFGSYLCYSHEFTSKQCCQICKQLKQTSKVGCEYGDHVDNCKILTPSDCYDLRNKHSCCATCERFKKPYAPDGCEYGDNVDRCDSVRQNPGLCYVPNNYRSCCETCNQIKNTTNPSCTYGDYIPSLCQTYDGNASGVRVNCYSPHRRKICCQTCERIRERASTGMPADCQYGDRPISFYYPQYGRLTCSSMFQFIDVSECRTNPVVASNCCYTCSRYISSRG